VRGPSNRGQVPGGQAQALGLVREGRASTVLWLSPGAGQAMSQQPGEGIDCLVVTEGPANRLPPRPRSRWHRFLRAGRRCC